MTRTSDDHGGGAPSGLPASPSHSAAPAARISRRHVAHASLFAAMGALLAAIVPGFSNAMHTQAPVERTSMLLDLPDMPTARYTQQRDQWQTVVVGKGETLSAIFELVGVSKQEAALDVWMKLGVRRFAAAGLLRRIWGLRDNLSGYDATYVALAEALGVPLATADGRLGIAPGPDCPITVVRS